MSEPTFQPVEIFRALGRQEVDYVVIGGLAATLHGSPLTTGDVDICPSQQPRNLKRLSAALNELRARIHVDREPDGIDVTWSAEHLARAEVWNLNTSFGRLDISFTPSGTRGYDDLVRDAVSFELAGMRVPAASLADIIRSKEAAGRERDRQALPTLRRLLERIS